MLKRGQMSMHANMLVNVDIPRSNSSMHERRGALEFRGTTRTSATSGADVHPKINIALSKVIFRR